MQKSKTKVVILAGGLGTRLREETEFRPKPMIEIGGRPIIWHIMKIYAAFGYTDYLICLGYKGELIRDYFINYEIRHRDFTITLGSRDLELHSDHGEHGWRITLVDTGTETMTGGRLKRIAPYLKYDRFLLMYGDGVADIDISRLMAYHQQRRKLGTVTGVRPLSHTANYQCETESLKYSTRNRRCATVGSVAASLSSNLRC